MSRNRSNRPDSCFPAKLLGRVSTWVTRAIHLLANECSRIISNGYYQNQKSNGKPPCQLRPEKCTKHEDMRSSSGVLLNQQVRRQVDRQVHQQSDRLRLIRLNGNRIRGNARSDLQKRISESESNLSVWFPCPIWRSDLSA